MDKKRESFMKTETYDLSSFAIISNKAKEEKKLFFWGMAQTRQKCRDCSWPLPKERKGALEAVAQLPN